jgi:rpsU-divergently transcribed protein
MMSSSSKCARMYSVASLRRVRPVSPRHAATFSAAPPPPPHDSSNMHDTRTKLLHSALQQVHAYGWTQDAIAAAASDLDASISIAGMVQPADLVAFSMDHWNEQLQKDLQARKEIWKELNTPVTDRIEEAIKIRLGYLLPFISSQRWHEGMAMGIRDPQKALQTKEQLKDLVRIVAQAAVAANEDNAEWGGSLSSSLSEWEQLTLGGVYVSTELHLLTDSSPDYQDTWEFLRQRVAEWERLVHASSNSIGDPNLFQKGGDALYVASAVASSLAGGVVSLLQPNAQKAWNGSGMSAGFGSAPEHLWNALLRMQPPSVSKANDIPMDGTSPLHYESSSKKI